ncbi:hypothetical protein THAOC_12687 [Thalassiosira oceanica]|uniref:Uncharacterized protein n=1 Tax=Thalassiosira oceanica TaxID=159749 RepID=K0SZC1_THAOC|nr:hypothetical protein THAOC_12687 [Thalassiosira oceanica]|eukprot:EJK66396.1 hypothetical protein THAOC_12687 [Thalassiosira oceanica]
MSPAKRQGSRFESTAPPIYFAEGQGRCDSYSDQPIACLLESTGAYFNPTSKNPMHELANGMVTSRCWKMKR